MKKIYKLEDLYEIEVGGDFVCQYLNGGQGYTVYYMGEDYPKADYTTSNNHDFIMELYYYFEFNNKEFAIREKTLKKIFSELEKKYTPINLIGCVIDPDDEDDFLGSNW